MIRVAVTLAGIGLAAYAWFGDTQSAGTTILLTVVGLLLVVVVNVPKKEG
jgi:hypothetical protein